jgi:hypothetical protein
MKLHREREAIIVAVDKAISIATARPAYQRRNIRAARQKKGRFYPPQGRTRLDFDEVLLN